MPGAGRKAKDTLRSGRICRVAVLCLLLWFSGRTVSAAELRAPGGGGKTQDTADTRQTASKRTGSKAEGKVTAGKRRVRGKHGVATGQTENPKHRAGKGVAKKSSGTRAKAPGRRLSRAEQKAAAQKKALANARSARLRSVFVATAGLRPMAQQLASSRSAAAYAAVAAYARSHTGAAGATAYLALAHAYALDHRYNEAITAYHEAAQGTEALNDYAAYLGAQSLFNGGRYAEVPAALDGFAEHYPESIFKIRAPMLVAKADLQLNNPAGAVQTLEPLAETPEAGHADFRLILGEAYEKAGKTAQAGALFRKIYVEDALSASAATARDQLIALGLPLSAAERKVHADQMFNAHRYTEANAEYSALRNDPGLSQADRDGLLIYSAVTDLKLKRLDRKQVDKLPATNDDTAALKLYLYAELSRKEKDSAAHDGIIAQMLARYPASRWFEEALYSGGNMYLVAGDYPQAIYHYKLLAEHFPNSIYAPSAHWREAWLNYRLQHYTAAAALMDEQVTRYAGGQEVPSALYWRGRIYEDQDHDFAQAASYYRSVVLNYTNFYYGGLARRRIAVLGVQPEVVPTAAVAAVHRRPQPDLASAVPEDDPHYIKAKLLANAALNEYIEPEIDASPDAAAWGALAEAQIYASYGEITRALQSMKHSGIPFFALSTAEVPLGYWNLLLPKPYWGDLVADSERNGLDPYLVASLIRQESEFNAGAVSSAHAYGLMQLLPSVGKANARKEGIRRFSTNDLLNPATNLQLGTRNLKAVLDRFGGQPEYALAAYNAGDVPVRQWMAIGGYRDIAEFVESIPYSETRGYVEAIVRNRDLYRQFYAAR